MLKGPRAAHANLKGSPFMNSFIRLLVVVVVIGGGILAGLLYLGNSTTPTVQTVEKVLPNAQFPR
jgi:hypothetical protein